MTNEQKQKILKIAADSDCAKHKWNDRGKAPIGYIKGMALLYAKCFVESKGQAETAVSVMKKSLGTAAKDALVWYKDGNKIPESDLGSETDRLRALFTLGIGLGMRESSGNPSEGRDTTVQHPTANNAEAGLFQTSFDSFGISSSFPGLRDQYKNNLSPCLKTEFMEGNKDKNRPLVGSGAGAEYQKMIKDCPAFAGEYAMVMLRIDRKHFGPINRREAEYLRAANDMLKLVEAVVNTP